MNSYDRSELTAVANTAPPFWLPLLAGLPITLCLVVMALPVLGEGHALESRALYLGAFLFWIVPLTALQRMLWGQRTSWWVMALILLTVTYLLALANNLLGIGLAWFAGWESSSDFRWQDVFGGLEGCWLALIAFVAIHAVVAYYAELKHTENRYAEALLWARDAELHALRYQIRPHFLFNTLSGVTALIDHGRTQEARQMLCRLADFLRSTLEGISGHEVVLAEELALTETYLEIEKTRMGDRLLIKWSVGADLLRAQVPTLILQPLVENAVRHGIAPRSEPGRLMISVAREGQFLLLRVNNDMSRVTAPEPATEFQVSLSARNPVGLVNVRERLAKLYPGQHEFHAGPNKDCFEVKLRIPFRELAVNHSSPVAAT